jgi:hypothetical protein
MFALGLWELSPIILKGSIDGFGNEISPYHHMISPRESSTVDICLTFLNKHRLDLTNIPFTESMMKL